MSEERILPVGYFDKNKSVWYKHVEIEALSVDDLMVFGSEKAKTNPYQSFLQAIQKGIVSIRNDEGEALDEHKRKLNFLPFADVIFCVIELVMLTKEDSKITTSYKCKHCREFTTFDFEEDEEGAEIDNREDIRGIDLKSIEFTNGADNTFMFEVENGFVDKDGNRYNSYQIEYPKFKTYLEVYNLTNNILEQEREVYYRSMISVNGLDETEMNRLKTKFGRKIFLPKPTEYAKLQKKLRLIGYNLDYHEVKCSNCNKSFVTKLDLSNFFGSILPT